MRGKWLPQDVSLADAARAVGVTADTWSELQAKAKAGGMVLLPGPRTQVVDVCQEGLCMAAAEFSCRVSNAHGGVTLLTCAAHEKELREKAAAAIQAGAPITVVSVAIQRAS